MKLRLAIIIAIVCYIPVRIYAQEVENPSYAWHLQPPLARSVPAVIDTMPINYGQQSVPSAQSVAYVTTGNLGAEGETLIYMYRQPASDFFFRDALSAWLPTPDKVTFYNTRIPMTLLSYNFGGSKTTGQDRLKADFSGNINSKAQVGAMLDYLHSKGSYASQAAKDLAWGFSGSYIGDRYQFQGYWYHYNSLNLENGGITDDRYITDPAEVQGGITSVDTKNIPTRLSAASSRVVGGKLLLDQRYNLGFYREVEQEDSIVEEFVPVTAFSWIFDYTQGRHEFHNSNSTQGHSFWTDYYLTSDDTRDRTTYWNIKNTIGVSLLEGFNKYAKAGLSAFITHEYRRYIQTTDTINRPPETNDVLTPLPISWPQSRVGQNLAWVGAQLIKSRGTLLNYDATAQIGFAGEAAGELIADGGISTKFKLLGDTVSLRGYGHFSNKTVPYLLRHYISNHFAWDNDFGKTRRVGFGGTLNINHTFTSVNIGVENIQNLVYFDSRCLPVQHSGNVQVFSVALSQNFRYKAWNWENCIIFQQSSDQAVIPLPKLAVYSNMYLYFRIAKVLQVQFGLDCNYYTKYKALGYQPATMSFYNADDAECGNYPFVNLYLNMKLSRCRFYLMFSHINQGLTGNNYFAMPGYPLNPRRFQLGVSIDFLN